MAQPPLPPALSVSQLPARICCLFCMVAAAPIAAWRCAAGLAGSDPAKLLDVDKRLRATVSPLCFAIMIKKRPNGQSPLKVLAISIKLVRLDCKKHGCKRRVRNQRLHAVSSPACLMGAAQTGSLNQMSKSSPQPDSPWRQPDEALEASHSIPPCSIPFVCRLSVTLASLPVL